MMIIVEPNYSMVILALSAAFVGLIHSLSPGHWLPVVLVAKGRRWPLRTALLGAFVAALGHIILSVALGGVSIFAGFELFSHYEEEIEHYAGLGLVFFGLAYAALAFFRHAGCHGHTHHGPKYQGKAPFVFLFSIGLSPCIAVLPILAAAATQGSGSVALSLLFFSGGVFAAFLGATYCVSYGFLKLDHPLFEHYGDVITGLGVALMGAVFFVLRLGAH